MSEKDEYIVSIEKDNRVELATGVHAFQNLFKHPIIVTVVATIVVAFASNIVTKAFQLRDKKLETIAMFENDIPREIRLKTHLAKIRSVLETSGCSTDGGKELDKPFVIGLTGKTCSDAESLYLKYFDESLKLKNGASLTKMRTIFDDDFIKRESSKLKSVLEILSESSSPICIVNAEKEANKLYIELLEVSIDDIEGKKRQELRSPRPLPTNLEKCNN
ncbi:hypothetical protein [Alteromonas stellipolaris]|uniref:Uncharacterized protein n=1 Tax=Alteromonas stellipolaris TaxID=233316 RepID=A0AAW7Z133_9ALTE|nr:hypothetical protein [Alteromonas stellipolaris]MDO6575942.1 hypothetical protein [Alteromonas stellipolaris]